MLDVLAEIGTADPEPELLRLGLNTLYAAATGKFELDIIKAAFEVRAAVIAGFAPSVVGCSSCGESEGDFFFDVMAGAVLCRECYRRMERSGALLTDAHESHIIYQLSLSAISAMAYAIYAPLERLFSFKVVGNDLHLLSRAAEGYLVHHLERGFKTLDFYNEVKR